jgi:hypothetical protein
MLDLRAGRLIFLSVRVVPQVTRAVLAAVAFAPALAHVLELPGKRRLARDVYLTVQTDSRSPVAWAKLVGHSRRSLRSDHTRWSCSMAHARSLTGFVLMQAIYWIVIHPVNKHWLKSQKLGATRARFFAVGGLTDGDWSELRDRWEYAHAARAAVALLGLLALSVAMRADV